jgi:cytochrome c biogenesis protein CcdA
MAFDVVFLAGLLSFFSPCTVPLMPVYFAELAGGAAASGVSDGKNAIAKFNGILMLRTVLFVIGISTSFVLLGFGAGLAGKVFGSRVFQVGCGILAIILGIHQTGLIRFRLLERQKTFDSAGSSRPKLFGAFLLGFAFSFGWTPCVGPVLATVLALASNQGQAFGAAQLMLVYSAGLAIPFLLISVMGSWAMDRIKSMNRYLPGIQMASGLLIIVMGLLLMTDNLNALSINL